MNENYPLFTHWYATLSWILTTVERFPRSARFSLASHLANLALDTMEGIVEAIYTKNRRTLLDQVNRSLEKQRVLFRIAHDRRYLSTNQHTYIVKALDETGRMVGGWRKDQHAPHQPSL